MEEKQPLDKTTIIGYLLLIPLAIWYFKANEPSEEELAAQKQEKAAQEQLIEKGKPLATVPAIAATDSLSKQEAYQQLGVFGFSKTLPSANGGETVLENELLKVTVSNKGGYPTKVILKEFSSVDEQPVALIKDGANSKFGIDFSTSDNRTLNTGQLFFEPTLTKVNGESRLSMKLKVSNDKYIEYVYLLKKNDYMLNFTVRSQGLENVIDSAKPLKLDWELSAFRNAKSVSYEARYTDLIYEYDEGRDDSLSKRDLITEEVEEVTYAAYRQHFFSSILVNKNGFDKVEFTSQDLSKEKDGKESNQLRKFSMKTNLKTEAGNLNYPMQLYFGPTDYSVLSKYDLNLDEVVPLGWGIFGVINRYVFIPLFSFLTGFLPYGVAIIVLTVLVRLALSPVTYKSYVSQAKMKVLKPDIEAINKKYEDNPMKKQQEVMALYNRAGANPMSGCLPSLLQIPVFYALFNFFPSAIVLRQKSFLWAEDLSSYDVVAELPFKIPFYGDHISLFPILASIAIFFYIRINSAQRTMMPKQEGMPDMRFIMYLSPVFMLIFFNNYASGLSLYYFVSNLITIGIMLVIKNYIVDDEKIHARIQENKTKPKKQNKFQQRLKEAMEEAQRQQQNKNK